MNETVGLVLLVVHALLVLWVFGLIFFVDYGFRSWITDWKAIFGTILVLVLPLLGPIRYLNVRDFDDFYDMFGQTWGH